MINLFRKIFSKAKTEDHQSIANSITGSRKEADFAQSHFQNEGVRGKLAITGCGIKTPISDDYKQNRLRKNGNP